MNEHRAPQDKVCGYEYTVRRGDSFYLIANRLGIPLRDLLEANADINPARLMVGDVLCIPMEEDDAPPENETPQTPQPPAMPESPAVPETPAVPEEPGAEISPPEEPVLEEPLPEGEDLDVPAVPAEPVDPGFSVCPEENRYTIRQGETIADVQLKANVNRYSIQQANPTADLDQLAAGQVLCVPRENAACPVRRTYVLQQEDRLESVALRMNTSLAALLRVNPCLAPSDFTAGQCIYLP